MPSDQMDIPRVMIFLVVCGIIMWVGARVLSVLIRNTRLTEGEALHRAFESLHSATEVSMELSSVLYGASGFIIAVLFTVFGWLLYKDGR